MRLGVKLKDKCYNTIDELPARRWFEISKTGNLTHILKSPKKVKEKVLKRLYVIYMEMREDHKVRFGLPESYVQELTIKEDIYNLQKEYFESGRTKNYLKTHIGIKRVELDEIKQGDESEFDLDTYTANLATNKGFHLDINNLSTAQYFGYIKSIR